VESPGCLLRQTGMIGWPVDQMLLAEHYIEKIHDPAMLRYLERKVPMISWPSFPFVRDDLEGPLGPLIAEVLEFSLRDHLLCALLDHMTRQAENKCTTSRLGGARFKRVRVPDVIRIRYYGDLFSIWTRDIGGSLRFSRDPISGTPHGPLIHFLQACTHPVMDADAPSLETLCDAIKRERRLRTDRHGKERERWEPFGAIGRPRRRAAAKSRRPSGSCGTEAPLVPAE